jgi:Tol biopolymer transport system component
MAGANHHRRERQAAGVRWLRRVAVIAASLVLAAPLAGATFPGTNGLLVYEAKVGKHYQLFTIKGDGTSAHQLTHFSDSDAVWGAWSPSGKQIAFERDVYTGVRVRRAAISIMNADGSGPHVLRPAGLNGRPSWSPDESRIVFSTLQFGKEATVSLMQTNGSHVRKLFTIPLPANGRGIGLDSPTFSPDGKRIAFVWHKPAVAAIYTMKATGGGLKQVTPWQKGGLADKVDWSPDGTRIAYSSPDPGVLAGVSSNVFIVRPDGTGLVQLTKTRGGKIHNGLDGWSPDGTKIAFARIGARTSEIYVMNVNGGGMKQLTRGPDAHHAAWGSHP